MRSIWEEGAKKPSFAPLEENKNVDVLIVGGGISGILCAYMLKEKGVDCVLIEADSICGGITKNTTAKVTFAHGLIYSKLAKRFGYDAAKLYLEAQNAAVKKYAELCREISCDYEKKDSYVYSTSDREAIEREARVLEKLGVSADFFDSLPLPIEIAGAVRVKDQAQFHPLKFLYGIAKNLPICERTKLLELKAGRAVTNRAEISYKKMIVATHFPIFNKHGSYFLKQYQHRSYVLALDGAPDVFGMYVDEADGGLSFRNYKNLLLLGGGGHRTGKRGSWEELEAFAKKHYKDAKILAKWATQDCMTLDGMPYIGRYSKNTPDVYVATGFNKWGMSSSMLSAMMLSDIVLEKESEYVSLFSPSRSILHPQLAVNAFESIVGLLTPTAPRCPHLGCALKYNSAEHSWDCPCHGSRFTGEGELISGPATEDKKM